MSLRVVVPQAGPKRCQRARLNLARGPGEVPRRKADANAQRKQVCSFPENRCSHLLQAQELVVHGGAALKEGGVFARDANGGEGGRNALLRHFSTPDELAVRRGLLRPMKRSGLDLCCGHVESGPLVVRVDWRTSFATCFLARKPLRLCSSLFVSRQRRPSLSDKQGPCPWQLPAATPSRAMSWPCRFLCTLQQQDTRRPPLLHPPLAAAAAKGRYAVGAGSAGFTSITPGIGGCFNLAPCGRGRRGRTGAH